MAGIISTVLINIPVKILNYLFSSKLTFLKINGIFLYVATFFVSFYIMLVNAAIMGVDESNNWTYSYTISFLTDTFIIEIIGGFVKLNIFNLSIKSRFLLEIKLYN